MAKRTLPPWRIILAGVLIAAGLAIAASSAYITYVRSTPPIVTLKYGELLSALEAAKADRSVRFAKVQVSPTDVRGEITTRDLISGAEPAPQTVPFRAVRLGFE